MATEKTPASTVAVGANRAGVLYSLAVGAVFAAVSTATGVLIGLTEHKNGKSVYVKPKTKKGRNALDPVRMRLPPPVTSSP